jgi:hypothetical protein
MLKNISLFFDRLGKFWQEPFNYPILRLSFVLLVFQIVLILWFYKNLPPQIPLYFSRPWGASWLASTSSIFILPIFTLLTIILNYSLAFYYRPKKDFVAKILVIFTPIIALFSVIAVAQIISLSL